MWSNKDRIDPDASTEARQPYQETEDESLVSWEELRAAVTSQPEARPSSEVRREVWARIRVREASDLTPPPTWTTWAWGVVVAFAVMIVLWGLLEPGIVLEWTLENHTPAAFRIYRTTLSSGEYIQIAEAPVEQPALRYRYVDPFIWPGQT
ncbi:MAG: hypothetical protein ACP5GX_05850, partial [Anaerolineae bacterium]